MSIKRKGHIVTQETRDKISKAHRGRVVSLEQRQRISATLIAKGCRPPLHSQSGEEHPMFGKHHSKITKQKMSNFRRGRTYEEIYGNEMGAQMRKGHSLQWKGRGNPNYKGIDMDAVRLGIKNGMSQKELAFQMGCSPSAICYRMKQKEAINV